MTDDSARAHYSHRDDPDSQTAPDEVRRGLAAFLDEWPVSAPVLDLGSGVGGNLRQIAGKHPVVGAEISFSAARQACRHAPVVVADGARLPFSDAMFGAVVCTEVLEHVDDPRLVFAEMARVLRPGGIAYVTTPNYANVAGLHKWIADRRSGRHDWNPWGAHHGGFEAFMTGRKLWRAASPSFRLARVRGLDYGQALTGRFGMLDRLAWGRAGRATLRWALPRLYGSSGRLAWHGMHIELVLHRT